MAKPSEPFKIELDLPSRLELLGVVDRLADGITEHMEFEDMDKDFLRSMTKDARLPALHIAVSVSVRRRVV